MKTVRNRIFVFTLILLLLPALPLSIIITQLLDKSYRIGVNEQVESALDNALQISADLYQVHKTMLESVLSKYVGRSEWSGKSLLNHLENELPLAQLNLIQIDIESDLRLVNRSAHNKFIRAAVNLRIWPEANHTKLYALVKSGCGQILEVVYPLPVSFQNGAQQIQQVNQIYKTLSFAKDEIRQSFLYTFFVIYSIGIFIALAVAYFISQKITRPIELLTLATQKVGYGDLGYRIKYESKDELGALIGAFNNMVSELDENQRKIINLEKMASWQQLARRLAHEIKNPLTPIQLMAQQMRDKYTGDDQAYQKMLTDGCDIIEEEVGSLKKLVREFSDFARLPEYQPVENDVRHLLKSVQKLYGSDKVKIDVPDQSVLLYFDNDHLKRALINLIDNGLAAGGTGSEVEIKLSFDHQQNAKITVEDRGQGITPDNLQKIFEPYFSTKRSGVGLGLSIVKKIIDEHNGEISVRSVVNEGTIFTINLPRNQTDKEL